MKKTIKFLFVPLVLGALLAMPFLIGDRHPPPLSNSDVTIDTIFSEDERTFTFADLLANIDNFVQTPAGGISWHIFGTTKEIPYDFRDEDGMDWQGVKPEFSEELSTLDGSEIIIQGYMFPLGQNEGQELFLLGPFPISCPYHYHVTPSLIIEVHAQTPVKFSYDAVNIKGRLELVPDDSEFNTFYRLHEAIEIR